MECIDRRRRRNELPQEVNCAAQLAVCGCPTWQTIRLISVLRAQVNCSASIGRVSSSSVLQRVGPTQWTEIELEPKDSMITFFESSEANDASGYIRQFQAASSSTTRVRKGLSSEDTVAT